MKVIIEAIPTPNIWHFTEIPELCIYANETFIADDGTLVLAGDPANPTDPHLKIPCELSGANVLLLPSIEIDSTPLIAPSFHTARYTAILRSASYQATFLEGFAVPPQPTSMNWDFLRTYQHLGRRFSYGPAAEHQAMVTSMIADALTFLRYGSETQVGMVALTKDGDDPIFPTAVSANDPDFLAAIGGAGGTSFKSSDYASLVAAVTAIGATPGALRIQAADFPSGASVTVPLTLVLDFGDVGTLALGTGHTVTIQSDTADYPRRNLWTNALAGQGTISFTGNRLLADMYLEWWGGAADGTTDNLAPAEAVLAAWDTIDGGTIRCLSGDYNFSASPNWLKTDIALVGQPGTNFRHTGESGDAFVMDSEQPGVLWVHGPRVENINILGNVTQLSGSATADINDNEVTGAGTAFLTEIAVGHAIAFDAGTNNNESRIVTAVSSDTSLTVDGNWNTSKGGAIHVGKTRNGIYMLGVRNATLRNVKVHDVALCAHYSEFCVTNIFEQFVISYHDKVQNTHFLIRSQFGVWCDLATTTWTYIDAVIEGTMTDGILIKNGAYAITFVNGTSEGHKGRGANILSQNNKFLQVDFEANDGIAGDGVDVHIFGSRNLFDGCLVATKIHVEAGQGNRIVGGTIGDIENSADQTVIDGIELNGNITNIGTLFRYPMINTNDGGVRMDALIGNVIDWPKDLIAGATISTNARDANLFYFISIQNFTLANPTFAVNGQEVTWRIKQGGSHAISYGDKFRVPSSKNFPQMPVVAGEILYLRARYSSTDDMWDITGANSEIFALFEAQDITAQDINATGGISVDDTLVLSNQQPAIVDPAGGAVVDVEARAALASLLGAVRTHGLIAVTPPFDLGQTHAWYPIHKLTFEADALVNKVRDLSGNRRHLLQGTLGRRPIFKLNLVDGKPALRFDGIDDVMSSVAFAYVQPICVSVVLQRHNNTFKYIYSSLDGSGIALFQGDVFNAVSLFAGTGSGDPSGAIGTGEFYLMTAEYNGASSNIYENGVLAGDSPGNPGSNNGSGIVLGNRGSDFALPSQIDVAELVIYHPSIRTDVEAYLMAEYSL